MGDCYYSSWPEEENVPENVGSSVRFPGQFGLPWPMPGEGMMEGRAASASKSHSEAEKRRRDRINTHLATLRKHIPKSEKMDKAALLGSVIDRVKDLKKEASEATDGACTLPTEVDEVTVDFLSDDRHKEGALIRASVCCEDRPEVFAELAQALSSLGLRLVEADVASSGGRIKSILVVCAESNEEGGLCSSALKDSLSVVLSRIATSSAASSCRFTSKRQRFFFSSH